MEAAELKKMNQAGGMLIKLMASPYSNDANDVWKVEVEFNSGERRLITKARTDEAKAYRTMDGIISDMKKIGLNKAEIII